MLLFAPSFMDSWPQLETNLVNERILECYDEQDLLGFIVFNPELGRISQLGINAIENT
jgi:hypothetical protein